MRLRELILRLLKLSTGGRPRPLWKRNNQDIWWYGASIHGNNTPAGTPPAARKVWDDIVQIDPNAPPEFRPFWVLKIGNAAITEDYYDEIRERTEAGYRVIFTRKDGTPEDLVNDVYEMNIRKALPWGVGLWNELEFGEQITPQQFYAQMNNAHLAEYLGAIWAKYGVHVTPPGLSSFANTITGGYGEAIAKEFADVPEEAMFIKVHNYGHIQPKYLKLLDLKPKVQEACGFPNAEVIIEEIANDFIGQSGIPANKPGVYDEQGADYHRAVWYAGAQSKMATCHFMLFHSGHHYNDISDELYGRLRRIEAKAARNWMGGKVTAGDLDDLNLDNPKGREIDLDTFNT